MFKNNQYKNLYTNTGNAVTNPGRFIEKKAFGVTNRNDSIFNT